MRTMFIVIAIIVVGFLIIGYSVVEHFLPYSAIRPHRITREQASMRFSSPTVWGYKVHSFTTNVNDTISLKCEYISDTNRIAKGTILLVHGISSCKEHMYGNAEWLLPEYDIIVFDMRAHGESGGLNCTYGAYEKYDIQEILNTVIKNGYARTPKFAIMGFSLGAAVAMQSMAIENRFGCGIFEGGFANFRETYHDYGAKKLFVRLPFLFNHVLEKTEKLAQFSADTVVPERAVRNIKKPVLFIHGGMDTHIPLKYAQRNYTACGSADKQLKIFDDAAHHDMADKGGGLYKDFVLGYLREKL